MTEDSTIKEFRQALVVKMQSNKEKRLQEMTDVLKLPENATQEDIRNTMKEGFKENKTLFHGKNKRLGGILRGNCTTITLTTLTT